MRGQTAVYNAEPEQIEAALETTCDHLGLTLIRSGHVYIFGGVAQPTRRPQKVDGHPDGGQPQEVTTAVPDTVSAEGET